MHSPSRYDRTYGALLGLAYGDALSFPAMFHRSYQFPERRREFIWRTNRDLMRQRIVRLTLPFTHRLAPEILEPFPTDDTEYALFTAQILLASEGSMDQQTFTTAWQTQLLPIADQLLTGFSERAALENLRNGILPPASGNDNPQHYDDCAAVRAVSVGLFCAGDRVCASDLAELDARVTNAEDGIYAAQAMATAIAMLADGRTLDESLAQGRAAFPAASWISRGEEIAQQCRRAAATPSALTLLLQKELINTVYSYGNAAPETIPAAFAIVEACGGDLQMAVPLALTVPKAADSLPALVGALCGAYQGAAAVDPVWRGQLNNLRGICIPLMKGVALDATAQALTAINW